MHPAASHPARQGLPARLLQSWADLFRLAWPVMLSRAGLIVLGLADVVMVGQYGTTALAHISMGYAVFIPIMVTGVGMMVGVIALASRAFGAGDRAEAAAVFRRGLAWALVVGLASSALVWFAETWLTLIGQSPDLAQGGGSVARWLAPGAALQVVFVASSFYLEATNRTMPGLVVMAIANVFNLIANWLLIGGNLGFPEMGAEGAVLASVLARVILAGGIVWWVLRLPEMRAGRGGSLWGPGGWAAGREMRVIGLSSGAAYFFETGAFAAMSQIAGLISPMALAAYSIGHQVETIVFMVALGLAVGTAVRVGQARGAGRIGEARFAGWSGLAVTMLLVGSVGIILFALSGIAGAAFSADPAMIERTAPLFAILALSLVFDAGQAVIGQANRALGDAWGTTLCFFLAFWCVMLPLGIFLGLHTPLAERGLFIATIIACATAVILLSLRFHVLLARAERAAGKAP